MQPECYKQFSVIFTSTTKVQVLQLLSATTMATATQFGAKDIRGLEDQTMEVDQQQEEQQVEQVEESQEPGPEPVKPVSRFGCASE